MKLTRKKAIELSKELWVWLAETGKMKHEWPRWEKYGWMTWHCPLCEYAWGGDACPRCPYWQTYGHCCPDDSEEEETIFSQWDDAKTSKTRKKYARLFLEQLEELS